MQSLDSRAFDRLLVVPYFLFEGVLMERIRTAVALFLGKQSDRKEARVTAPFGDHPLLLKSIAARLVRFVDGGSTAMPKWVQLDPTTISSL